MMMMQGISSSNNNNEPNQMIDKLPGMKKDFVDQIIRNGSEEFKKKHDMEMSKAGRKASELKEKQLLDFRRMLQKCGVHDDDGRIRKLGKELDSQLRSFKVRLEIGCQYGCANGISPRSENANKSANWLFWLFGGLILWRAVFR
jgi:hypothetical protein